MMNARARLLSWVRAPVSEEEFERVYRIELPRIYNFFRYRVGDGPIAEDLTADTFEKAWRKRHRYRHDIASFFTWLYTIARRVAIDHYRRQRPQTSLDNARHLESGSDPELGAQRQLDFERLTLLLVRLEERDRELVALRYGAGLTNRSIADLTGLSESNVAVILHRALKKLRVMWEEPV